MYKVYSETYGLYLEVVIDAGCDHWTRKAKDALVFFKKKDIPKRFLNKTKVKIIKDTQKYKLFGAQKQSINQIYEATGISKSSLYDFISGIKDIENMNARTERKLADYFGWEQGKFHDEMIKYKNKKKKGK